MKRKEIFFLISEGEIDLILSEVSEVLEDLQEILNKKKLTLSGKEWGSIRFDSDFLSTESHNLFENVN
jgi:hypothetical protein